MPTFAEKLYDLLQEFPRWTLWESRLVRVLESYKPSALDYVARLESAYGGGSMDVAYAWPSLKTELSRDLPAVLQSLNF